MVTMYNVVGRYMDGSSVVAYHLTSNDGSWIKADKEKTIWLIQQGLIGNMRTQVASDGEVIIRGRGTNLNKLPVYDENKQSIRGKNGTQSNKKDIDMFTITRRIIKKEGIVGYEIVNRGGKRFNVGNSAAKKLATKKRLTNAVLKKYRSSDGVRFVLVGYGCNLNELPYIIMTDTGELLDPDNSVNIYRAIMMKRAGSIYSRKGRNRVHFKPGQYVLLDSRGNIETKNRDEVDNMFERVDCSNEDSRYNMSVENDTEYLLEIYGYKAIRITPEQMNSWDKVKVKTV
mgnify:CR=1 FL=1